MDQEYTFIPRRASAHLSCHSSVPDDVYRRRLVLARFRLYWASSLLALYICWVITGVAFAVLHNNLWILVCALPLTAVLYCISQYYYRATPMLFS